MENWLDDFEHSSLATPESQESAKQTLSKFGSKDDVVIGYLELQKQAGKPFRLPESMDKLPSDESRQELQAGISKLVGVIKNEDAIPKDFNFAEGLEEGGKVDENMVAVAKKFAIDSHLNLSQLKSAVTTWNTLMRQAREGLQNTAKAEIAETNKKLLENYNGDEGALKADIELMRRTFKNNAGLSAEEYEQIAEDLMSPDENGKVGAILRKPVLAGAILKLLAPMSKEGGGERGKGGETTETKTQGEELTKELPKIAKAAGWKK